MYPSSNIVIFVNFEDILNETEKLLKNHKVYLCISYDTDMLAFENLTRYATLWINLAKEHKVKLNYRICFDPMLYIEYWKEKY